MREHGVQGSEISACKFNDPPGEKDIRLSVLGVAFVN